ncbi:hypothetical protein FACS1894169_08470 [Bacteroidia bacterium]|nr:hypothetical protein FACS1894169_08470 [Bacteroidia bacterium]
MEYPGLLLIGMLVSVLILYVIGLIKIVRSRNKYKYSYLWIVIAVGLFWMPAYIFVMYSYCEKKKDRTLIREGWTFFVLYLVYLILLDIFFKYGIGIQNWHYEISILCTNISAILYQVGTFLAKK